MTFQFTPEQTKQMNIIDAYIRLKGIKHIEREVEAIQVINKLSDTPTPAPSFIFELVHEITQLQTRIVTLESDMYEAKSDFNMLLKSLQNHLVLTELTKDDINKMMLDRNIY